MSGRDRMVILGGVVLAILVAAWIMVVSPEREQASKIAAEVSAAHTQLASAEGQLASARTAQSQYSTAYASVVTLGKAVPPRQEVPSLMYQLALASDQKSVQFTSIVSGSSASGSGSSASGAGSSGSSASGSAASAATAGASATAAAGFTQMPFTFVFEGSFFDLEHLFRQLTSFTTRGPAGALRVSGRLLTIQSVKLAPVTSGTEPGKGATSNLSGTITATAYVLPASQGLTGASTGTAAAGTGAATPATSTTGASSSPTAPAIVRVNP